MDQEFKILLQATSKREWPNSTLKSLNTFRQSEPSLCDVFLRGDEPTSKAIPAHRCVLAANSVYFHAMFTSGLAESKQEHREITIRGVDTDTLSHIVEFLYVGSCRLSNGTLHGVMDLLAAATMLQVDELAHACSVYLEKNLDSDSALEMWLFAESYGVSDLVEPCKRYVQSYFRLISQNQRVLELDPRDMMALLALEQINLGTAAKEEMVADLLFRWLIHNLKALDSDLVPIFSKVCWSEVSQDSKESFKEKLAELFEENSSESLKAEEVLNIISSSIDSSIKRTFFCSVCALGGLQNSRAGRRCPQTSSIEVADVDTRTGTILRQWAKPRGFHGRQSTTNINPQFHFLPFRGHVYAFYSHGQDGTIATSFSISHGNPSSKALSLSVANIMNGTLKMIRTKYCDAESVWWDLIDKHNYAHAVDEEKGVVYLCGCAEQREGSSSKRVFKLEIENNKCSELTSLPFGRSHHRAIVVNGELFVLGGVDWLLTPLSTVLKYNWNSNEWEELSPMHEPRIDGAYACVDGRIYASGGSTSKVRSRSVEVYNPHLDVWTTLNPMSVPRVNHGLVAVGTNLFAMGGQSYSGENGGARNVQRTVERFSIKEGTWEPAWEMAECRWGMAAFTL